MNILGNNSANLNEIIFENRNKNYGAYVIRTSYNNSLLKSLLLLSSIVVILFLGTSIYNKMNAIVDPDKGLILDELKNEDLVYEVNMELPQPKIEKPVQHTAAAAPKGGIATTIVDDAPLTTTVSLENPLNGQGPETAKGTSTTSTLVTTTPTTETFVINVEKTNSEPLVIAEEMPEFEGGNVGLMRYISQNISYPEVAKAIGKEGTVYVSFVVNELGSVENAKVMRGIGYGCDEEVLKVVGKMPKWKKAGKNAGHPVKVRFNIPVSFKLR